MNLLNNSQLSLRNLGEGKTFQKIREGKQLSSYSQKHSVHYQSRHLAEIQAKILENTIK